MFRCVYVKIIGYLFICRLTPARPLLLISAPTSLFRSPPSWLFMKTLLLERQVLRLKASNGSELCYHRWSYSSISNIHGWESVTEPVLNAPLSLTLTLIAVIFTASFLSCTQTLRASPPAFQTWCESLMSVGWLSW